MSGEIETTTGEIVISKNERLSILRQDHYQYDNNRVIDVVIMGNDKLYKIMEEKNKMYEQTEFSEEDGMKLANLEAEFMDLDGWNAESDACTLLNNLGIDEKYITGNASDWEKFEKWASVLEKAIGNPLYHWSHLELKYYFNYDGILNKKMPKQYGNFAIKN